MERLDSSLFDWLTWRNGSITDILSIPQRTECLINKRDELRKYAIGWCPAEETPCRPKTGYIAVMFLVEERQFWTHLTKEEFEGIGVIE